MSRTVLLVSATPRDASPLRVAEEMREIQDILDRSRRHEFRVVLRTAARPRDVRRALLEHHPTIVHFSGHGHGELGFVLEDDHGDSLLVSNDALADLFSLFTETVVCVLLNGCHSQAQVDSIAQNVPFVIGMSHALDDRASIVFACAFYDGLGNGESIPRAFELGCSAVRMDGLAVEQIAVLAQNPNLQRKDHRIQEGREHCSVENRDLTGQLNEELQRVSPRICQPEAAGMPEVRSRMWLLLGGFAGASCVLTAVLIWAPLPVQGWLSGALAALVAGTGVAFAQFVHLDLHDRRQGNQPVASGDGPNPQDRVGTTRTQLVSRAFLPGHDPVSNSAPVAVTVKLSDVSFVHISAAHGAAGVQVPVSGHSMQIAVEALDGRTVILSGLRPVVLSRQRPRGYLVPHAGILPLRRFTVLLDDDPPLLKPREQKNRVFPFKVAADDPEVFELRVETERWDVNWVLELDWICAGREGTTRIDLAGHPFRCMARPPGPSFEWGGSA